MRNTWERIGQAVGDSLTFNVLGTLAEIEAHADAWRALERDCADPLSYFQSYDWCSAWIRQFGTSNTYEPYIVTVWLGEMLVAVWPRMIVRSWWLKRLETLGVPHSQYCGILIRRGYDRDPRVAGGLRATARASGCDVTISRAVPEGSALAKVLTRKAQVRGGANVASMLDLAPYDSAEDYTSQLGKLQKRNRNRRRNHLARLGELSFEVIWPDHAQFGDMVRLGTEMKRRWLAETGRFSVGFSMSGYEDFLASLDGDGETLSGACVSVLRAGDRIVAIELGFISNRHYYAYIGGFDWDLRDLSPGKVQMEMTVGWLIDNGVASYDLLINPADYKKSWTSRAIEVSTRAEALTWRGHIYATAWLPTVRPALKRIHQTTPVLADRAVVFLRPAACLLLYV